MNLHENDLPFTAPFPGDAFLSRYAPLTPCDGCGGIVAHQADDLFALWEAWERQSGVRCPTPYWASVWPAAMVLAHHLLSNHSLAFGKTVLDLGCGGGVTAIAAAKAGASRVIANDIDPIALEIARRNFAANGVTVEVQQENITESHNHHDADLILVADLFYHRTAASSLIAFLRRARKRGAQVLIADSNRPFAPATGIALIFRETVPVALELEGVPYREVKILSLLEE
ncbi:MAG: 50S ribosomal protein L11 methyltransferase [Chitinispirillaceae bacterium]|nr:50S ribosomal protein L11 methyltransferase [Chitinispirillaceae bacterium]